MKIISRNLLLSLFVMGAVGCSSPENKALEKFKADLLPTFYQCVGAQGSIEYNSFRSDDVSDNLIVVDVQMRNRRDNVFHIQYLYNTQTSMLDTRPYAMEQDGEKVVPLFGEMMLGLFCL